MMQAIVWVGVFLILLLAWRMVLLFRVVPPRHRESFDGVVYRVGNAAVAVRRADKPRATVVCMHGFCESLHYFSQYYADPEIQLIALNSGDYHVPIANPEFKSAAWCKTPAVPAGTIEYDAAVLVQALEHLPVTESIRVHGHSRGGAVTLEAAALRPDLFRNVEVILEAPVLPRARPRLRLPAVIFWLLPFLFGLWRRHPISKRNRHQWGRLDDQRKRELIESLPFNARRNVTLMRNMKSLVQWAENHDESLYRNVQRGAILIAADDWVLDPVSMRESAERAGDGLKIVPVTDCSHFIVFDQPGAFPPVTKQGAGAARRAATPLS